MNITEVKKSLDKMFAAPLRQGAVRNIVFWYDETGAFAEEIDGLSLENAKTIKLYDNSVFATKLYIEREDTQNNLLVYSPLPRPTNKENWLTDAIKYSQTFSTDEASLILLNYKMDNSLRPIAETYKTFFRNNDRCRRFEGYGIANYTETKVDVAILSALCKLPAPNFDACIRELLCGVAQGDMSLVDNISKFGNLDRLWLLIERSYGYRFPDHDFEKLAILLLVTHLAQSLEKLPSAWSAYKSDDTNGFVFVDGFMKMSDYADEYKALADMAADKLHLSEQLARWKAEDIIDCDTFRQLDTAILGQLLSLILSSVGEYDQYKKAINNRRNRRWFIDFETEYHTLLYACEFLALSDRYKEFSALSCEKLWKLYEDELYKFDTYYRKFICSFDSLSDPEDYRVLADKMEKVYTNRFLSELSVKWCELLDNGNDDGIIGWGVAGVIGQERFYESKIKPFVRDDERIIVIISDALRYEAAVELLEVMKREHKGTSELTTLLGAIPSYTKLGMAVLLPHKEIVIKAGGEYWVDGISTQGTENREKILKAYKSASIAITYEKLSAMSKQEMSALMGGMKVVYIYHNVIDARGDHAATEREVFDATEKAIRELTGLVRTLKNNVSAISFFITADHGYIYRRTPLSESDKTPKETAGSIDDGRRYILTKQPTELPTTQRFSMKYLGNDAITAVVPSGMNGYKKQGAGANYVHGGSSLQEVMVPLIKYRSGKNIVKVTAARKVNLNLTSISRKVTSVITYLNFFQNEQVADKLLPLRVQAYFEDENGERISNENIIIADSASPNPEERTYKEKFTLRNIHYDKAKTYYLVIKDDDEMVDRDIERIPFTIDLVFGSGIQF
ncbi:MAG: BREX-1 system phosphatase PglZ type A [Gracilibacteraceae bacterium]|jgi:uncharacterized protein (TIGR02687 family)|nr:BREX-1 system phosphatase PglZ type A [Gracilibacteraceae bacterium]